METRRWLNQTVPQTLFSAQLLLYFNAVFALLAGPAGLLLVVGHVAAAYGIANERRWGYHLGLAMAFLPPALRFLTGGFDGLLTVSVIAVAFEALLIFLLLHPQSREHQRIWFS